MLNYLKAAFWHQERVPMLGSLPVNALALAGMAALGCYHRAFWWLGGTLEAVFLFLCCSNERFRRLVDAKASRETPNLEIELQKFANQLTKASSEEAAKLNDKLQRLAAIHTASAEDLMPADYGQQIQQLTWLQLKLLIARDRLQGSEEAMAATPLAQQIEDLRAELAARPDKSKAATLAILEARLRVADQRRQKLDAINTDLKRIQHQVDLLLEQAVLQSHPVEIEFTLTAASGALAPLYAGMPVEREIQRMDDYFSGASR
jgi:hypothetical protein